MTLFEKWKNDFPNQRICCPFVCPAGYGYEKAPDDWKPIECYHPEFETCKICWDRPFLQEGET